MVKLDEARAALAAEEAPSSDDFGIRLLQGEWLMKKKGIPFDALQAYPKGGLAKEFATNRPGTQKTFRADFEAYREWGPDTCGVLCRAWAHRMQYSFGLEISGVVPRPLAFKAIHFEDYEEPSEFTELAARASGRLIARVAQIRAVPGFEA